METDRSWFIPEPDAFKEVTLINEQRGAVDREGWETRSKTYHDGHVIRFRQRNKPGCPGVVERRYDVSGAATEQRGAGINDIVAFPHAA